MVKSRVIEHMGETNFRQAKDDARREHVWSMLVVGKALITNIPSWSNLGEFEGGETDAANFQGA